MSEDPRHGDFAQWQIDAKPFQSMWDTAADGDGFTTGDTRPARPATAQHSNQDDVQSLEDTLQQHVDKAYQRGFDEGQKLMAEANSELMAISERLTVSIDNLKPVLSGQLCEIILGALSALLENTAGFAVPDGELLAKRCNDLAALAERELTKAQLHIHPDDRALIGNAPIGLQVIDDPALLRGTISIEHQDGYLEQGTQPVLDELKAMLDEMELAR